jgi:hypothetical protein
MRLSVCLAIFAFLGVLAGGLAACQDQGAAGEDGPIRDGVVPSKAAALERPAAAGNAACTAQANSLNTAFVVLDAADARPFGCSRPAR